MSHFDWQVPDLFAYLVLAGSIVLICATVIGIAIRLFAWLRSKGLEPMHIIIIGLFCLGLSAVVILAGVVSLKQQQDAEIAKLASAVEAAQKAAPSAAQVIAPLAPSPIVDIEFWRDREGYIVNKPGDDITGPVTDIRISVLAKSGVTDAKLEIKVGHRFKDGQWEAWATAPIRIRWPRSGIGNIDLPREQTEWPTLWNWLPKHKQLKTNTGDSHPSIKNDFFNLPSGTYKFQIVVSGRHAGEPFADSKWFELTWLGELDTLIFRVSEPV